MIDKIDISSIIINEIDRFNNKKLEQEKFFIQMHKTLCNDVLYTDSKYKESTIILTHIFRNLMMDFCKEVSEYVNNEGVYKNE